MELIKPLCYYTKVILRYILHDERTLEGQCLDWRLYRRVDWRAQCLSICAGFILKTYCRASKQRFNIGAIINITSDKELNKYIF